MFVDGVRVIRTDLIADNGVVHVVEGVLLPEPVLDIVETAQEAGSFNTLLAALDAADLTSTLKGDGPFTYWPRPTPRSARFRRRHSMVCCRIGRP